LFLLDADELTERRPFVLPRALGGGHIEHVRQEESSEEDDDESEAKNRLVLHFFSIFIPSKIK
jgi:hypothetical protein